MGLGLGNDVLELPTESIMAAFLRIILAAGLAWLYFDYVTLAMEEISSQHHSTSSRACENGPGYLQRFALPDREGVIFVAFGLKKTVAHRQVPLETIPAVALCGGGALYLFGDVASRLRDVGIISKPRLVVAILTCAIVPIILEVPSLTALVGVVVLFITLAAYETIFPSIEIQYVEREHLHLLNPVGTGIVVTRCCSCPRALTVVRKQI